LIADVGAHQASSKPLDVRKALVVLAGLWGVSVEEAQAQIWSNYVALMAGIKPQEA